MQALLDVYKIRQDFPILSRKLFDGKNLVYLDNAATTQKPKEVIDAISRYYSEYNANIHRAVYQIAEEATEEYEKTREKIRKFINARHSEEIIFTRNTTESINLVAYAWGGSNVKKGNKIILTEYEHHSNLVPWQVLGRTKGAKLNYLQVDNEGYISLEELDKIISITGEGKTKLITLSEMSNVLGTIFPVKELIKLAHDKKIPVLLDGAQSVPHMPTDVQDTDCDFLAFSAHKMLGPTGVGVLYVKKEILEKMNPFISGGDMIKEVHKENTIFNEIPYKFEGGTPNIADVIGFGAAIDYLNEIGMKNVREHEVKMTEYLMSKLTEIKSIKIYGPKRSEDRGGLVSFNIEGIHPHDCATILNDFGVAIRSGHHCAQVLMEKLDIVASSRASLYIYNTKEEIDILIDALNHARRIFKT
ncbi:MAG: aminotransferase class V-fold PLP-dependent enzyme [Candidatus Nitrosocosmicus sp.]|jgi:cysteine desulfurase/selenocysteine lyase|uniref:aminotransferase class V-fold PLP-dependent enzyme n=1 Tax=Candidatus Nitrosocosmicus agrestis TaxID=2563600 RepID=UPI00122E971F|nr:cysteine desulfurase [Candidatus Nitrosocosmicus sp. SS]KAA2282153.1 cysteine desulfurase [Candidatus Nitrosocosmicus sp. SS]KAF0870001.1 cysteine desulfurase [Candidatus Nitrosocosmicus sp. SS]MDR4492809.1 cysteine desulfurase [Candidatus Nitrosocosmicus sp.]